MPQFKLGLLPLILLLVYFQVAVHLEASPDFLTAPLQKARESHCVCVNERHTISWIVTPKSLGEQQGPTGSAVIARAVVLSRRQRPQAGGLFFLGFHS